MNIRSRSYALASAPLMLGVLIGAGPARAVPADAGSVVLDAPATAWHAPLSDDSVLALPDLSPEVPSPRAFLGHAIGQRFTRAEQVTRYLEELAETSDRVQMWDYGETYEGRPLHLLAIATPAHLARLDEIRARHLERLATATSVDPSSASAADPAIVWLSYGVHGNEASSTEAALATAYVLAAAEGEWAERLDDVIVLLDPLTNPDGRERYVHHYQSRRGRTPDRESDAAEHREPWPGGRQNHYLADLNRDWTWLSQIETRKRVAEFIRWQPHVYVDLHEMSPNSSYFFPPSAAPVHPLIDARTVDWLETFGAANAAAFEDQGWIFYTGEQYDLFYPGYGDSYPSLRNSVGMTYEMAGGGRAGLVYERRTGSVLRLADRAARHLTTSLSTIHVAAERRAELQRDQLAARADVLTASPAIYLWSADEAHGEAAAELLHGHGVPVERLTERWRTEVTAVGGGDPLRRDFPASTYFVDARHEAGNLIRTLFELEAEIDPEFLESQRRRLDEHRDTQFFDITAWSLPLAFDLMAWRATERPPAARHAAPGTEPSVARSPEIPQPAHPGRSAGPTSGLTGEGRFGYLVPARGLSTFRVAAELQRRKIPYRQLQPHSAGAHGGLFLIRKSLGEDAEERAREIAHHGGLEIERVATGYDETGVPYGSEAHPAIQPSRIGIVLGEGVSPTGYGHLWHLLDRTIEADHHQVRLSDLPGLLSRLDVVVLPDGSGYGRAWDESEVARLSSWIERGGVLVAIGEAASWLREAELIDPESWPMPEGGEEPDRLVPGAVLETVAAAHHPLFAGFESAPPVLFYGTEIWPATGDPAIDLLVAGSEPVVAGFAWPESEEDLADALLVGEFRTGDGRIVVFSQNPAFRMFWRATMPLFLNAVLHGPSWP